MPSFFFFILFQDLVTMNWLLGDVQAYGQRKSPNGDALFFPLLFQDLVTASIAIEPGGSN